jgi:hypothetical protein
MDEEVYYIWSNEHNAWWRPSSAGYTGNLDNAGLYPESEAIKICNGANWDWDMQTTDKLPNEIPVSPRVAVYLKNKQTGDE